jgi:transposase
MNEITTVGVDLAKEVIVVCATDTVGNIVLVRQFSFQGFGAWAGKLPPCTFAMEACGSAHYWARRLAQQGHTARLMAGEFVTPFRKSKGAKNDRNDAQAILAAVRQPDMRFVAVKSVDQQAMLGWHRMRAGWEQERTALMESHTRIAGRVRCLGRPLATRAEAGDTRAAAAGHVAGSTATAVVVRAGPSGDDREAHRSM